MDQVQYKNEIKSTRQRLITDYECIFNSIKEKKKIHNIIGTNRPFTQCSNISKENLNQSYFHWQQMGQTEVTGLLYHVLG